MGWGRGALVHNGGSKPAAIQRFPPPPSEVEDSSRRFVANFSLARENEVSLSINRARGSGERDKISVKQLLCKESQAQSFSRALRFLQLADASAQLYSDG